MKLKAALILCTLFALGACSSGSDMHIDSDYNSATSFASYKTYKWHATNNYNEKTKEYLVNDIMDQRIRQIIDEQLSSQGFQKTESGEADFLVNYSVTTEEKVDINTYNTYSGFAPGWSNGDYIGSGPYRYGSVMQSYNETVGTNTEISQHQQGTLIIDIVDPATDKLMWRGSAEGKLKEDQTREGREAVAKEAISKILTNFPPKK